MDRVRQPTEQMRLSHAALFLALRPDPEPFESWLRAHVDQLDWHSLLERAAVHKVAALFAARLERSGAAAALPEAARERIAAMRSDAIQRAEMVQRSLEHLSQHFGRAGVPFFVIKGSVLAHRVYGDPTLRRFTDIDLVVHGSDVLAAEAVLRALHYRWAGITELLKAHPRRTREKRVARGLTRRFDARHLGAFSWYQPYRSGYAPVDLHWQIAPYRLRLREAQVWEQTESAQLGDLSLRTLNPAATLLHLAAHATTCLSNAFRLLHLNDVVWAAHGLSREDTAAMWDLARQWRSDAHMQRVFEIAQRTFGVPMPSAPAPRRPRATPWTRAAGRAAFLLDCTEKTHRPLQRVGRELAWGATMQCLPRNVAVATAAACARARFRLTRWLAARPRGLRRLTVPSYLRWQVLAPLTAALYRATARHLSWWPLSLSPLRQPPAAPEPRLAYYHHLFPLLSETFIQREVTALRAAGLPVDVISHGVRDPELFDAQARELMRSTIYVPGLRGDGLPEGLWESAVRHPLRLANIFLYLLCRQHTPRKNLPWDRELFNRSVYLAHLLRQRGITHVHSPWATQDATIAMLAARLADVRYSLQARASDIHRDGSSFGRGERLAHAAFVVTNTRYNEAILRRLLPANGAAPPLHVIYNGIDVSRFQPTARHPSGERRVLCVGRLVEPKGLEYLLTACKILRDAGDDVRCEIIGGRIAGEVNSYLRLRKMWRALELESVVTLTGPQPFDRVLQRYETADVFVMPAVVAADNRREVTPNVLIEAMAMRMAVIGTPIGAIPEIIEDGVSGLIVPSRDAEALAAAIKRLLDDPALRERLGAAARRRVETRFDIRQNVRSYVQLFGGPAAPPHAETLEADSAQRNAASVSSRSA